VSRHRNRTRNEGSAAPFRAEDPPTVAARLEGPGSDVRKPSEIKSISQLFAYAYSRAGRVFSIAPAVAKILYRDDTDYNVLAEGIARLATSDPLFDVPPKILSAIDRATIQGRTRITLLRLAVVPMLTHPGLASAEIAAALPDQPSPDQDMRLRSVREAIDRFSAEQLGVAKLKPADRRNLKSNVVLSVALYLAMRQGWSSHALAECLNAHLWQEELAQPKFRAQRALLADSTTPAALGLVAKAWGARLDEQARQVLEAQVGAQAAYQARDEALGRADDLAAAKKGAEAILAQREREIARLERDLATAGEQRRVDRSHAVDDRESLRTQVIRALDPLPGLLEDGLHALQNDSGQVTEEFMERVMDALRAELEQLRNDETQGGGENGSRRV
jgi:hypothetical protein